MKVIIDNDIKDYKSIWMDDDGIIFVIDQRKLPFSFEILECKNIDDVCFAIKDMVVRGAPLIGITAGYGLLQSVMSFSGDNSIELIKFIEEKSKQLAQTRPTAVDLFNVIDRITGLLKEELSVKENIENIRTEVNVIVKETLEECYAIGKVGNELIPKGKSTIMTICNAGALATVDYGTALAPIREAKKAGKEITIFVNETRPRIQGGRLTAWELFNEGINHYIISDNAAGYYINKGIIDLVITGADRIALNGDVANKIGTYALSVLCKENNVPFYVAAPKSTFDFNTNSGKDIIIEERDELEVKSVLCINNEIDNHPQRRIIHNINSMCLNPAFDITPAKNITGIITPKGVLFPPYNESIKKFVRK